MRKVERQQQLIRQFLLGDVKEEDRQSLEERFLTDREYRTEVLMVESELLEDYVKGVLSDVEKAKFQKHYLTAPRQERKLRTIQALAAFARSSEPVVIEKPAPRWWLARFLKPSNRRLQLATVSLVVVAVLAAGVIWRIQTNKGGLREELAQLNAPENIARMDESILAVALDPITLREKNSWPKIIVTPAISTIQLDVPVADDEYQTYHTELRTVEGDRVAEFKVNTRPRNGVLPLRLPVRILPSNDYTLTIQGVRVDGQVEGAGDYSFRVLPR